MDRLKKPSDYPQMYFRIEAKDKKKIEELVDQIIGKRQALMEEDAKQPKRNKLLVEALTMGLEIIRKQK